MDSTKKVGFLLIEYGITIGHGMGDPTGPSQALNSLSLNFLARVIPAVPAPTMHKSVFISSLSGNERASNNHSFSFWLQPLKL
jgi:hypothetical protein